VIALLLVRSALSQMDVPTRSSYVMAIVTPAERPRPASITSVPRSCRVGDRPAARRLDARRERVRLAARARRRVKIVYDLLLLAMFRTVKPPEEAGVSSPVPSPRRSRHDPKMRIQACLWFDKNAEEAARFYTTTFPDSRITSVLRSPTDYPSGKAATC
jgi:hypothetical protein